MLTEQEKKAIKDLGDVVAELKSKLVKKEADGALSFFKGMSELTHKIEFMSQQMIDIAKVSSITKDDILEALSNIKLEPKIVVNSPELKMPKIEIPEVKVTIPPIKVPKPEVTVNYIPPKIEIPAVKGGDSKESVGFLEKLLKFFKGVDRDNPLHTILVDEKGNPYRASMAMVGGGSGGGASASRDKSNHVESTTLELTLANTVYSFTIPDGTTQLLFKTRVMSDEVVYSWDNFTNYVTLPPGGTRNYPDMRLYGKTLYFKCPLNAGNIVEIEITKTI